MIKLKFLLPIFIIYNFSLSFGAKNTCEFSNDGRNCTVDYFLEYVHFNETFGLDRTNLTAVTNLEMISRYLVVLDEELCEIMPNLINIQMRFDETTQIVEGAFRNCKQLKRMTLNDKVEIHVAYRKELNIKMCLHRNTFIGAAHLEYLSISRNPHDDGVIQTMNLNLTDLKNLTHLSLSWSTDAILPIDTFRGLTNLETLVLHNIGLFDLNIIEGILKNTPKLMKIDLTRNYIKCSRLKEISTVLKTRNIEVINEKQMEETCVTIETWEKTFGEKVFHYLPDIYMKSGLPLGQTLENMSLINKNLQNSQTNQDHIISQLQESTKQFRETLANMNQTHDTAIFDEKIEKLSEMLEKQTSALNYVLKQQASINFYLWILADLVFILGLLTIFCLMRMRSHKNKHPENVWLVRNGKASAEHQ